MSHLSDHAWSAAAGATIVAGVAAGVAVGSAGIAAAGATIVAGAAATIFFVGAGVVGTGAAIVGMTDEFRPLSALGGAGLALTALFNPTVNFIEKVQPENKTETPAEMVNEQEQTAQDKSVRLSDCTQYNADKNVIYVCPKP